MQNRIRFVTISLLALTACLPGKPKQNQPLQYSTEIEKDSNLIGANLAEETAGDLPDTTGESLPLPTESAVTPLVPSLFEKNETLVPSVVVINEPRDAKTIDAVEIPQPVDVKDTPATEAPPVLVNRDKEEAVEVVIEASAPVTNDASPPPAASGPSAAEPEVVSHETPTPEPTPTPTPTPELIPAPIRDQPVEDTYESALAEIDKYRSDVAPFVTDNAADSAKGTVWLGDGVNALNGERTPTCLNLSTLSKQTTRIAQTHDNFEFVHNYYDFWKKMHSSVTVGGSGTFPWFTLGASVTTSSDNELYITKDDLLAVASFNYLREEQTLYNARPAFAPFFNKQLARNKGLFRSLCGDSYTKSVALGGTMRIVFSAKKRDQRKYNKDSVSATLNFGFSTLFSSTNSFSFSQEQQEILNSYSFSMKCYTSGSKANICAEFGLNTSFDFQADGVSLQQRMDAARKRMADDVDSGENLVIVSEKFADYETPISMCTLEGDDACPATDKVYYNYHPRVDIAFKILDTLEKMDEICTTTNFWKNRCNSVRSQLTDAMRKCSQSSSPCEELKDKTQMNILLSAANPGKFSLWTDTHRRGDIYSNDFKGGDATGKFASNSFYIFSNIGWDRLNDKGSSVEVHMAPGWTLRFWEHKQEDRRGNSLDMKDRDYISNLTNMNDKISSFELIPPPDLGE